MHLFRGVIALLREDARLNVLAIMQGPVVDLAERLRERLELSIEKLLIRGACLSVALSLFDLVKQFLSLILCGCYPLAEISHSPLLAHHQIELRPEPRV